METLAWSPQQTADRDLARRSLITKDGGKAVPTGGRASAKREMPPLAPALSSPCFTPLPDKKQKLKACTADLERQNKELTAEVS
jgi:hypothetical protein